MRNFIADVKQLSIDWQKDNKKNSYANMAIAFDIETTSLIDTQGNKHAFMYIWCLQIDEIKITGRTWDKFVEVCMILSIELVKNENHYIIIYVHNLAYEFQFMRYYFEYQRIFALKKRKPVEVVTTLNIIFRCSYVLSGYSLANLAKNLGVKKLMGDLDYNKIRHHLTTITETEMKYLYRDCEIIILYIKSLIQEYKGIIFLPLTKTGFVRNYYRKETIYKNKHKKKKTKNAYKEIIKSLTLTLDEYKTARRAFGGGGVHGNAYRINKVYENVDSLDICSDYPHKMACKLYPMSKGRYKENISLEEFYIYTCKYNCIFDIEYTNIREKVIQDNPLSYHKCTKCVKPILNNGRIVKADYIKTTITEIDFKIFDLFYDYDEIKITNLWYYRKMYLPKEFKLCMLNLYSDKTTLKDVEGEEVNYQKKKENLNSSYGMAVTDIIQDEISYTDNEWCSNETDEQATLDRYNKSPKRFLSYLWGVYITAYAREELYLAIYNTGLDYIYGDTDSEKLLNYSKHKKYFDKRNDEIILEMKRMCIKQNIDFALCAPKTKDGTIKMLGVWEHETTYTHFKTIGAKRYAYRTDKLNKFYINNELYTSHYNITVSGLPKSYGTKYISEHNTDGFLNMFNERLFIPSEYTGKKGITYLDNGATIKVTDYNDLTTEVTYKSGAHMENAPFDMHMSSAFIDYLLSIEQIET